MAEPTTMGVGKTAISSLLEVRRQVDQATMAEMMEMMDQVDPAVLTGRRLPVDPEDQVDLVGQTDLVDLVGQTDLVDQVDQAAPVIRMGQGGLPDTAIEHAHGMGVRDDADTHFLMMVCRAIADIMEPLLFQSAILVPHRVILQMT